MNEAVICQGLQCTFQHEGIDVRALRGIDLCIEKGEFSTLAGPSGSGKTTLLNIIGGLRRPTLGGVSVNGTEITKLGRNALADLRLHQIGFIFQSFNLIPVLSAAENVEFTLSLLGVPRRERRTRALHVLKEVGLAGLEHRRPTQLSGGQQQRVAVARALGPRPAIVLADEPTGSLDSTSADELISLMTGLNESYGTTFLVATHDPAVMARARRNILLADGRIASDDVRATPVAA